jgi:hypothetical protein
MRQKARSRQALASFSTVRCRALAERFEGPRKVLMPSRFDPIDLDSVALGEGSGPEKDGFVTLS